MRPDGSSGYFGDFEDDDDEMERIGNKGTRRDLDKDFDQRVRAFVSVCTIKELMVLLGFFNDRVGRLLDEKARKDTPETNQSILRSLAIIRIVLNKVQRSVMQSRKRKFSELRNETSRRAKKLKSSNDFAQGMQLKEIRFLGKGGFASVSLVKDVTSGFLCARKTIKIDHLERQLHEIDIHKKLKHDNVVAFLGENRTSENLYVFLQYVNGGTLQDRIHTRGMSERRARFFLKQLIAGVKYIHSKNIAHRDIKPDNLFLTKDDDLKIGDFGLASEFVKGEYLTRISGTLAYIAPEVFSGKYLGEPVDVWACGVVLFTLVTGQNPWEVPLTNEDTNFGVWCYSTEEMRLIKPWKSISRRIFHLIKNILVANPEERATISDIEQDVWFLG